MISRLEIWQTAFSHPPVWLHISQAPFNNSVFSALRNSYFGQVAALLPVSTVVGFATRPGSLRGRMQAKELCLERVVGEVEDLASRVAELKGRFAQQRVSVKLEHYWELEYVRTGFAEFKRRIQDLEFAEDRELEKFQEAVESAWRDLVHAVDTLLAALP